MIKNIFDLVRLQSGSLHISGYEHASAEAKSLGMYLSSNDYLPEFLTAREYVSLVGDLFQVEVDHSEARDLFHRFSMEGRYDHLIEDYSHGMRKKTQLVCALVMRRPLTVIDETLNGIDLFSGIPAWTGHWPGGISRTSSSSCPLSETAEPFCTASVRHGDGLLWRIGDDAVVSVGRHGQHLASD